MKIEKLPLSGATTVVFPAHSDERGWFKRIFCSQQLSEQLQGRKIVSINLSHSLEKGTVRGIHYQAPPYAEIKIVRCLKGTVFDVIVDIRRGSPTFLAWHAVRLSADNSIILVIPEGFAHGFQTLTPDCELLYLHTEHYYPKHEGGLRYCDPAIAINWPLPVTTISERDATHPLVSIRSFEGLVC